MDDIAVKQKMQGVLDIVRTDIGGIRTGRAPPSIVEDITVPAYGGQQRMRVVELATITTPDTQTLVIDPWDKSIIGDIRKGIMEANTGLNPIIDSQILRISLPPLTTEDREKYVKLLSAKIENGKIMIRQIRGDGMRDIKRGFEEKEITEDEKFSEEKKLQAITDGFVGKIEELGEFKKQELLQI